MMYLFPLSSFITYFKVWIFGCHKKTFYTTKNDYLEHQTIFSPPKYFLRVIKFAKKINRISKISKTVHNKFLCKSTLMGLQKSTNNFY